MLVTITKLKANLTAVGLTVRKPCIHQQNKVSYIAAKASWDEENKVNFDLMKNLNNFWAGEHCSFLSCTKFCGYNFNFIMWQTFHDICTSNMTALYTEREHGEDFSCHGLPPHHSVSWLSALGIILYEGQQNWQLITQLNLTTKPAHCLKAERPASCYHRSTTPSSLAKQGTLQCRVEPLRNWPELMTYLGFTTCLLSLQISSSFHQGYCSGIKRLVVINYF